VIKAAWNGWPFGHIGNNHLHINILPRNEEELQKGLELYVRFARAAVDFGGSVSAEHGIGKLKRKFFKLMFSLEQIEQMKRIKAALDPMNLLNRAVICLRIERNR
jgi:D-lactate dehydrogenase (cytochrome)